MKKNVVRSLKVAGLLALLVLAACGRQAPEEPASDAAAEQPTGGDEEPAEEEPDAAPEVAALPDCSPESDDDFEGTTVIFLGSPPLEACVSSDVPTQSYVFSTSPDCETHVTVSGESALSVALQDPTAETVLESGSLGSGEATFALPIGSQNEGLGNVFEVNVSMDAEVNDGPDSAAFNVSVAEQCDDVAVPLAEEGPARLMTNPVPYSTDSDLWSMEHPAGWGAEVGPDNSINLANNPALLEAVKEEDFVIAPGQAGLTIFVFPTEAAQEQGLGGTTTARRAEYLSLLLAQRPEESPVTVGEPEFIQHDGEPLLGRVPYSNGDIYEGLNIVWDISDDAVGLAILQTAPGATAVVEPTIIAIVESLQFDAPVEDVLASLAEESE